jgi:hypothetical protein
MMVRHSQQIPMAQRGPLGSPVTEFRHVSPAATMATHTVVPWGTLIDFRLIVSEMVSGMGFRHRKAGRRIWVERNY